MFVYGIASVFFYHFQVMFKMIIINRYSSIITFCLKNNVGDNLIQSNLFKNITVFPDNLSLSPIVILVTDTRRQ